MNRLANTANFCSGRICQRSSVSGRSLRFFSTTQNRTSSGDDIQPATSSFSSSSSNTSNVPYRDVTIFNNGTDTPCPGNFLCVVHEESAVAHLLADCRNVNNNENNNNNTNHDHPYRHSHGEEQSIVDLLARMLDITTERAKFLIEFGAVQLGVFPPAIVLDAAYNSSMPPAQRELAIASRRFFESVVVKTNKSEKEVNLDSANRATDPNIILKTGNYLRIRLNPRRSPVAISTTTEDWRKRILYEDDSCIVMDKPSGIATVPTGENLNENLSVAVGQMLGYKHPPTLLISEERIGRAQSARVQQETLPYIPRKQHEESDGMLERRPYLLMYTLQRLDVGTSGCILMGKTKKMTWRWRELIKQRKGIRKLYKAFCFSFKDPLNPRPPVKIGRHTHFLDVKAACHATGRVDVRTRAFADMKNQRKECQMLVLCVQPIEVGIGERKEEDKKLRLWEVEIELLTGRTHQIRAQLETYGVCLVGDELYPQLLWNENYGFDARMGLQASKLELKGLGNRMQSGEKTGRSDNVIKVLEAGTPWWRSDSREDVVRMVNTHINALKSCGVINGEVSV